MKAGDRVVICRATHDGDQIFLGKRGVIKHPTSAESYTLDATDPLDATDYIVQLDDIQMRQAISDLEPGLFYAYSNEVRLLNGLEQLSEVAE